MLERPFSTFFSSPFSELLPLCFGDIEKISQLVSSASLLSMYRTVYSTVQYIDRVCIGVEGPFISLSLSVPPPQMDTRLGGCRECVWHVSRGIYLMTRERIRCMNGALCEYVLDRVAFSSTVQCTSIWMHSLWCYCHTWVRSWDFWGVRPLSWGGGLLERV